MLIQPPSSRGRHSHVLSQCLPMAGLGRAQPRIWCGLGRRLTVGIRPSVEDGLSQVAPFIREARSRTTPDLLWSREPWRLPWLPFHRGSVIGVDVASLPPGASAPLALPLLSPSAYTLAYRTFLCGRVGTSPVVLTSHFPEVNPPTTLSFDERLTVSVARRRSFEARPSRFTDPRRLTLRRGRIVNPPQVLLPGSSVITITVTLAAYLLFEVRETGSGQARTRPGRFRTLRQMPPRPLRLLAGYACSLPTKLVSPAAHARVPLRSSATALGQVGLPKLWRVPLRSSATEFRYGSDPLGQTISQPHQRGAVIIAGQVHMDQTGTAAVIPGLAQGRIELPLPCALRNRHRHRRLRAVDDSSSSGSR